MKTKTCYNSLRIMMVIVWLCHTLSPVFSVAAQETPPNPLSPPMEVSSAPIEPDWIERDLDETTAMPLLSTISTENAPLAQAQIACDGDIRDLIVNGGFEESEAWYGESTGEGEIWYDSTFAHNGESSLKLVGAANASLLAWQTVAFPTQVDQAVFYYAVHQDLVDSGDELYFLVYETETDEGLGWASISAISPNTWELWAISFSTILTDVVGQTVDVMFFAVTDDADHTTYHIDDVSLEVCTPSFCKPSLTNNGFEDGETAWLLGGDALLDSEQAHDGSASVKLGGYPGAGAQFRELNLIDIEQSSALTENIATVQGEAMRVPLVTSTPSLTLSLPENVAISGKPLPNLDTALSELVTVSRLEPWTAQETAQSWGLRITEDGRVQVHIVIPAGVLERVIAAVHEVGGEITGIADRGTLLQGWLPVNTLETLATRDDVYLIRRPGQIVPQDILDEPAVAPVPTAMALTEGLAAANGAAWHSAGYRGAGVKIGIIDSGFETYTTLLGIELPLTVTVKNFVDGEPDDQVEGSTGHGTACAEIIHDIAPESDLYLARIATNVDLAEAVYWLTATHSVDLVSTSFSFFNITPGDGTGQFADLAQSARDDGALWTTAAGNQRLLHWGGAFSDPDSDDWHNFASVQEINYFGPGDGTAYSIPAGYVLGIALRWDDWSVVNQDYDLYLYRWDGSAWQVIGSSVDEQNGDPGQTPTEYALALTSGSNTYYGFAIKRYNSTRAVNLEALVTYAPPGNYAHLDEAVYPRSLANLADVPDLITAGAVDVASPYSFEVYSSEGPTNGPGGTATGGAIKPDLVGYSWVSTVTYGPGGFGGTSAAPPHVTGAAALVRSAYPAYTPDQVEAFLFGRAVDMGSTGLDTQYGHGRLYLADPPSGPDISVSPAALEETLNPDESITRVLTIANTGSDVLTFTLQETATVVSLVATQPNTSAHISSPALTARVVNPIAEFSMTGDAVPASHSPSAVTVPGDIGSAWEIVAPLPEPRAFHTVIAEGHYVYAIGGTIDVTGTWATSTNFRYDTQTDTWATMTAMPAALAKMDGVAINGKLYIPGSGSLANNNTYVYDTASDTWSTIPSNGGYVAPSYYMAVAVGTKLYVLGGISGSSGTNAVWVLDTTTNLWSMGIPMQNARINAAAAAINGDIYVAGGVAYPGFAPDMTTEHFNGTAWEYVADVPDGGGAYTRWSYGADGVGPDGLWLAAGRRDNYWMTLDHAGFYDPSADGWTTSPAIPMLSQGRVYLEGDVAADGYFYVSGGRNSYATTLYSTHERLFLGQPDPVPWLDSAPVTGMVNAGESITVGVTLDAAGLSAGDYTAQLVFINNDPDENPVIVPVTLHVVQPCAPVSITDIATNSPVMVGETIYFTATATGTVPLDYTWAFGDDTIGTGVTTTHIYTSDGTYTVTLTAMNCGGTDEATVVVTVLPLPVPIARFNVSPISGTAPLTVNFTDISTGDITSLIWDFGDGMSSTLQNPTHTYSAAGVYTATLTVTGPGGSDSATRPITVNPPPPDASFNVSPISGTAPLTVNFTDTSTGDITFWSWDFGDGMSSTLQNPPHTYSTAGVYTATLTVTGPGGSDSAEQDIAVTSSFYGYGSVSQAFEIRPDTRVIELSFWLGTLANTDLNDKFYIGLYNTDFSESLWGGSVYYDAGYWDHKNYTIQVDPAWSGQTVNLAFLTVNNADAPHSAFWVDDVTLLQCPEHPHVSNAYIRADVNGEDGTLVIGTTEGDPETSNDDNRNLLYGFEADGYSRPWSSITTLRVINESETTDYILSNELPIVAPHQKGDAVVTRWYIQGIVITQSLSLVSNPHTNDENMVQIAYQVENRSENVYDVGLRSLLDVKIGENDGAPYFVPGYGNLIHETDFTGDAVPAYWKAFESPTFEEMYLRGQGILRGGSAIPPDRMVIAGWPSLMSTVWDYTIQTGQVVTADSAVALYWNPTTLYYAEDAHFVTYYGLAGHGGGNTWLDAPADVICGDLEFDVVQWVNNDTSSILTGGESTLTLPDGLALVYDEFADKQWPDIPPGEARSVQWRVASTGNVASTVTAQADAAFDGGVTLPAAHMQVTIPHCETQLAPPVALEAYPGVGSISLSWEPSPSPGVEGYHVYRKAGSDFARITTTPVRNVSYRDDSDTLTEGETYTYRVTAVASVDESNPSNEDEAVFGQLSLSIPSVYASQGSTVTVPINIANADDLRIDSMDVYLIYPTDTLRLASNGVRPTPLSQDYMFSANEPEQGTVLVALAGGDARLRGEGTLLDLVFEVIGNVGDQGNLRFDQDNTEIYTTEDLYNAVPLSTKNGLVTVRRNFKLGDLSSDGRVKSNDAAIALRIAVGKIKPTEEQSSAGDMNGDQRNNSADVALIMRMAVGLGLVPDNQARQMVQAIAEAPVTLSIGRRAGFQGDVIWVPINVDDAAWIAGGDLTLNYDPNVLEFANPDDNQNTVQLGAVVQDYNFDIEGYSEQPGLIHISLAQNQAPAYQGLPGGSGSFVQVQFTIKRSAPDGTTPVTLSSARLSDAYGRDFATSALQRLVDVSHGQVVVGSSQVCEIFLPLVMRTR